jgi:phosphoglycerate-specific signal transduction histidine kinase
VTKTVNYNPLHQTQTWQLHEFYIALFEQEHQEALSGLAVEDSGQGLVVYRNEQGEERARFNYQTLEGQVQDQ